MLVDKMNMRERERERERTRLWEHLMLRKKKKLGDCTLTLLPHRSPPKPFSGFASTIITRREVKFTRYFLFGLTRLHIFLQQTPAF